ncbi:MAG: DUF488 domain-containing protein [Bacteroidetes bacterium]|nr:DUF488 domain-containing protein [Bacteroidota bacterium]
MSTKTIYSIGYGNRKIEDFILLLKRYGINTLLDIRSKPLSRFQPACNKEKPQEHLRNEDIVYLFMGGELGAKPKDPKYYVNGVVSYQAIKDTGRFSQ